MPPGVPPPHIPPQISHFFMINKTESEAIAVGGPCMGLSLEVFEKAEKPVPGERQPAHVAASCMLCVPGQLCQAGGGRSSRCP